jgi:hypothetical protein
MAEGELKGKLDIFWSYFVATWMRRYDPQTWNIFHLKSNPDALLNRTNNPLERFNRELNDRFPVAHPSMSIFISTIQKISVDYAATLANISRQRRAKPVHKPPTVYPVPPEYFVFDVSEAPLKRAKKRSID